MSMSKEDAERQAAGFTNDQLAQVLTTAANGMGGIEELRLVAIAMREAAKRLSEEKR